MRRAERFKRAYAPSWRLSNQKEYFVAMLLSTLGYRVKFIGLGAGSERYEPGRGSPPDLAVYRGEELIAYVEVTGANFLPADTSNIYITYDKFRKYHRWAEKKPLFFVYLGFRRGKLVFARWAAYEDLYPYAEDPKSIIHRTTPAGQEKFISTPARLWKPIPSLLRLLLELYPTRVIYSV